MKKKHILTTLCIGLLALFGVLSTACGGSGEQGRDGGGAQHVHSYAGVVQEEPSCESEGTMLFICHCGDSYTETVDSLGGHVGGEATCLQRATCEHCGQEYGETLEHSFTEYVSDGNVPCGTTGTKTAYCDYGCGTTDTVDDENAAHPDHLFENYSLYASATCTENETQIAYCKYCFKENIITIENTAFGHDETHVAAREAKCGVIGWNEYSYCNRYRCEYNTYEEIPALEHEYDGDVCSVCKQYRPSEGLEYDFFSSGDGKTTIYAVVGIGTCTDENIVISSSYKGNPVTMINENAFQGCNSLKSVTIPDSITSIYNAFSGCENLEKVRITDLKAWFETEFRFDNDNPLSSGAALYLNDEPVEDLVIPDTVTSISANAFQGCGSLKSVTFTDSVETIGKRAFYACPELREITLSESVKTIEESAFSYCFELTGDLLITDSVETIGGGAFCYTGITSVTMGASVKKINGMAFDYCESLTGVYIKDLAAWSRIEFGYSDANPLSCARNLYLNGEAVTKIEADDITAVGDYIFYNCATLTSVTLPDSIETIGELAFSDCSALSEIVIPSSVKSIGWGTFYGCSALEGIVIPDSVETIGGAAFEDCKNLTSVKLPDGLTSISERSFRYCTKLSEITLPEALTAINYEAFENCTALTEISIPKNVTEIANEAFYGCTSLTKLTLPASLATVGSLAFEYWGGQRSVYYQGTLEQWFGISLKAPILNVANTLLGGVNAFYVNGTLLEDLVVPASVTELDSRFAGYEGLKTVTLHDDVTSIAYGAFSSCSALTQVTIGSGVTSIGANAFYNCALTNVTFKNPNGWWCSQDPAATKDAGTTISDGLLSSANRAATYLTSADYYLGYYWKRG